MLTCENNPRQGPLKTEKKEVRFFIFVQCKSDKNTRKYFYLIGEILSPYWSAGQHQSQCYNIEV